jgi:hypothetical protein
VAVFSYSEYPTISPHTNAQRAAAMVFDVLILALAAWRLWPDRGRGGISGILLRDGLAYFAAACAANGAQAVVAARAPSPVLALLFLPPALVVSTLAAATVFRNIDAAGASTPRGPSTAASTTGGSLPRFARFKRPGDSERTTTRGDDEPGLRGVPRLSRAASRSHAEHIELDVLDVLDYEPGGKLPAIDERAALAAHPSPLSPRATLSSPPPSAYAGRERRLSYHMDPPVGAPSIFHLCIANSLRRHLTRRTQTNGSPSCTLAQPTLLARSPSAPSQYRSIYSPLLYVRCACHKLYHLFWRAWAESTLPFSAQLPALHGIRHLEVDSVSPLTRPDLLHWYLIMKPVSVQYGALRVPRDPFSA